MIGQKILRRIKREAKELVLATTECIAQSVSHSLQHKNSLVPLGIQDSELDNIHLQLSRFNKRNYGFWQMDRARIGVFISIIKYCNTIEGDFAECGVYQGKTAQLVFNFKNPDKKLFLFDTFQGFTKTDREIEKIRGMGRDPGRGHTNTSIDRVKNEVQKSLLDQPILSQPSSLVIMEGQVQKTLLDLTDTSFCFVHLDMDLYAPTVFAIENIKSRISPGGVLLLHDYAVNEAGYSGVAKAIVESNLQGFSGPFVMGDQSSAMFVKMG